MNSEELELSLRSEFENYLKNFRAEIRQEAAELQKRLGEVFEAYAARFESDEHQLDQGFTSTVTEHLRLARDEGAKLTATAMAEAEQMERDSGALTNYSSMRDAVADISSQTSQSAILKSLVTQSAAFAPRGAFFIIKNEHFVGWKTLGTEGEAAENAIHDIHFPVSADTVLGRAAESRTTINTAYGAHQHDESFLDPLQFGRPDRMYAMPLVARGRGVAVMFVDHGTTGAKVNVEALETLVRVAGLTVELLAASQTAQAEGRETGAADFEKAGHETREETAASDFEQAYQEPPQEAVPAHFEPSHAEVQEEHHEEAPATDFAFTEDRPEESAFESAPAFSEEAPAEEERTQEFEAPTEVEEVEAPAETFEPQPEHIDDQPDTGGAMVFDSPESIEPAPAETVSSPFETTAQGEPAGVGVMAGVIPERTVDISPPPVGRSRLSDRNVDLPIDVADDERRLHNDARRFARLLVSEIKLYNEKKVQEGRQSNDLYERLREAIDRSREMYDKRVQPPVAAKFDYFHYELVNALADGNVDSLGSNYPGSSI